MAGGPGAGKVVEALAEQVQRVVTVTRCGTGMVPMAGNAVGVSAGC